MKTLEKQLEDLIAPSLETMGLAVVQLRLIEGGKSKTLQVFLEQTNGSGVNIDECATASRTISALLDVEDLINGHYNLEVSSPGIDRPLVKPADYETYKGFEVKIETILPTNGRRRYSGVLEGMGGEFVRITVDGETYEVAFDNIQHAKLKLTDALIKAHQEKNKQTA